MEPDVPLEPSVPDEPLDPELPDEPSIPEVPEVPSVPELPDEPSLPLDPELPDAPLVPDDPELPDEPLPPPPVAVIPVTLIVLPLLSLNCKVEDPLKYVPPVKYVSVPWKILQLAFSLVNPPIPSIVDPVHAEIIATPAGLFPLIVVPNSDWTTVPVVPVALDHNVS